MEAAVQRKLDELPADPGVYLMKDKAGAVVYVGKAASLRSRVRSYFHDSRGDDRAFIGLLEELLGDIDFIVTQSEKEAVLLENELIKKHKPRFNIRLRDDKDFIVLRLDEKHPYPRLEIVRARQRKNDGARYFGPYSSASSIRETLRVVNRHFQLRTCSDHVIEHRKRPCILYQIHRCPAPCVYEVPTEEYRQSVKDTVDFLEGRDSELVERLRSRMESAAEALNFESAALLRDQVVAVERSLEKQRVLMGDQADRDVFGLYREGPELVIQVLSMRSGKLHDSRAYPFTGQEFPAEELVSSFLGLYYEQNPPPEEVLVPVEPVGANALAEVLADKRGKKVKVLTPQRGAKADLLDVAHKNAAQSFKSWREKDERKQEAIVALMRSLHLAREPRWIECYDISTFQGALSVGSGVSMKDGELDKANYRRYKVKGQGGSAAPAQDDFAALYEVVTRRLKRALAEGSLPDLIMIDGGKGQLHAALAAAADLGVPVKPLQGNESAPFVEMIGLAKSRVVEQTARVVRARRRSGPAPSEALADAAEARDRGYVPEVERTPERVFTPGRKDPIVLRQNSAELFLLTRLRDEAHRFAITFHRKLRRERNFQSVLEEIPGIGTGRKKALLRHFGSLKRIKEATAQEIARVEGFGEKQAHSVFGFFRQTEVVEAPPISEADIDAALASDEADVPT